VSAPTYTAIAAGWDHTCAITTAGAVMCWGDNQYGQLGNGSTKNSSVPVAVTSLASGVAAVAAGGDHTCALTTAGTVMCWGDGKSGDLGDALISESNVPVPVKGLPSKVTAIAAGQYHTCAVITDGTVMCWGNDGHGQLGDDATPTASTVPVAVQGLPPLPDVKALAAGQSHSCALTGQGDILCWGANGGGQLGDGSQLDEPTAALVGAPVGTTFTAVAAGVDHTCAITAGGAVMCWGQGALGSATMLSETPIATMGIPFAATAITAGDEHSCVLAGGSAWCWGMNGDGQLGLGSTTESDDPTAVPGSSGFTAIAAGYDHTCGLTATGTAVCWGLNGDGQVGDGSTTNRSAPVAVSAK